MRLPVLTCLDNPRAHQRVNAFGVEGQVVSRRAVQEAARTKEDLADLINVGIEELVRQEIELPGFTTLQEAAQRGRAAVNRRFYAQVYDALGAEGRQQIDRLWAEPGAEARTTAWNSLKHDVGSPTLTHLKALVDHHQWLSAQQPRSHVLGGLPTAMMEQCAAEARSLDAAQMQALEPHKRYTLAAVLLRTQWSRILDDLGLMFIKRMMRIHRRGKEALALHHLKHQERTDGLIRTHWPDMLRVAVSIRAGRITAATILRRLGTYSRKNKLYLAFRELGRVVRTGFLLRYLADTELRATIQAATNKSEQLNRFLKWVFFGGEGIITENSRDEQRKVIKYNHLVANCLIFHNVGSLTHVIRQLQDEGEDVPETALARISPYLTEHINRFGDYVLNMNRTPLQPAYDFTFRA